MFPRLETPEEVRAALAHLWYPRAGIVVSRYNGLAASAATASRRRSQRGIFGRRPSGVRHALENLDEIAALDGVDALFIGPADLSAALGVAGHWSIQCSRTPSTRSSRRQPGTTSRRHLRGRSHQVPILPQPGISLPLRRFGLVVTTWCGLEALHLD